MRAPSSLQILSEKTVHHAANPDLIAYCPTMDLVALVTTDQQVMIYRLNGQRVYGAAAPKADEIRIESVRWKPNGQLLAIAWSNGSVRLVGAESSKVVHQFNVGGQVSGITCMGWASNRTNRTSSSISMRKGIGSWESMLAADGELPDDKVMLDLPRDLSLVDIETSLPKLSILTAGIGSEDVFSSSSSLDALFRPFDPKSQSTVDVMVVGTKEGRIHLSIYDSFIIGSFSSPLAAQDSTSQLCLHASHEQCSTHALLFRSSNNLHFVPMDLRFISSSSEYLSLLASRSTALQNLLRYIDQVQRSMHSEWKASHELHTKILRNINETLEEKGNGDIVQALYHSVATGHTFPAVREWLVDELSERGLKRWDKAVVSGLENLKRLVHENMLPALERCSLILSRFLGIAKFQSSNNTMGFTSQQISVMLDTVACLRLVSSKILIHVVEELQLFACFSAWLRYEIDRLASESSSSPTDDVAEKEASIDHKKVLLYLQNHVTESPLAVYLGKLDGLADPGQPKHGFTEDGLSMFDTMVIQIKRQEQGLPYTKWSVKVDLLFTYLFRQASDVFRQIAEAEKRNALCGTVQEIGAAEGGAPMDMRMSRPEGSNCYIHIAYVPQGMPSCIQIVRIKLSIEKGMSSTQSIDSSSIGLGTGRIKDIKIWDDKAILVLWELDGTTTLVDLPYTSCPENSSYLSDNGMLYSTHAQKIPNLRLGNSEVLEILAKTKVPAEPAFTAEKMCIRSWEKVKEGEDMRRIVLLEKNRVQYRVMKFSEAEDNDEDIPMTQ